MHIHEDFPNQLYSQIQIEADKYFENSLAIWTLYYQDMVDNFRQPVVNTNWESSAVQVNAFYHFTRNHISKFFFQIIFLANNNLQIMQIIFELALLGTDFAE